MVCVVVHEGDAGGLADELEAAVRAGELGGRLRRAMEVDAGTHGDGERAEGVGDVVPAGHPQRQPSQFRALELHDAVEAASVVAAQLDGAPFGVRVAERVSLDARARATPLLADLRLREASRRRRTASPPVSRAPANVRNASTKRSSVP